MLYFGKPVFARESHLRKRIARKVYKEEKGFGLIFAFVLLVMQYFASKKRKTQSPGLKTGRFEKNEKTKVECSPSAKGALNSYLRTLQDNEIVQPSCTTRGNDPIKMNFASEIDKSFKHENEHSLLLAETKSQVFEETHKGISMGLSEAGNAAFGNHAEGAQVGENPELKKFAADFLSLYCR